VMKVVKLEGDPKGGEMDRQYHGEHCQVKKDPLPVAYVIRIFHVLKYGLEMIGHPSPLSSRISRMIESSVWTVKPGRQFRRTHQRFSGQAFQAIIHQPFLAGSDNFSGGPFIQAPKMI